jgi:hypothetical protein
MSEFDDPICKDVQVPQRIIVELPVVEQPLGPPAQRDWQHDLREWGKMLPIQPSETVNSNKPPRRRPYTS